MQEENLTSRRVIFMFILISAAFFLGACSSPPPLPTETQVPTAVPTKTIPPGTAATSVDQVVGRWAFLLAGGGENDPGVLTLAEDGTTSMDGVGGYHAGMNVGVGTFRFEGDILYLESDQCTNFSGAIFPCTAKYQAYVVMGGNGPSSLSLIAIEDPHPDRKKSLNGKTLYPAGD